MEKVGLGTRAKALVRPESSGTLALLLAFSLEISRSAVPSIPTFALTTYILSCLHICEKMGMRRLLI